MLLELESSEPSSFPIFTEVSEQELTSRRFTFYRSPAVSSISPDAILEQYESFKLTVTLDSELEHWPEFDIICRLEKASTGSTAILEPATIVDSRQVECPFGRLDAWLGQAEVWHLSLSFNGGQDFSTTLRGIDVHRELPLGSAAQYSIEASTAVQLLVNTSMLEPLAPGTLCRVSSASLESEHYLPASQINSTHAECLGWPEEQDPG